MIYNNFRSLLVLIIFISFDLNLSAENSEFKLVKQRNSPSFSKIPSYMEFEEKSRPAISELNSVFESYWKSPSTFDFQLINVEEDGLGFLHYRYKQTFNGVPIEFAELIAHTKSGRVFSLNGTVLSSPPTNELTAGISESEALSSALAEIGAKSYKWENEAEENHLKQVQQDKNATYFPKGELVFIGKGASLENDQLRLAYKFNIYAQEPLSRNEIYIDAITKEVLFMNNLIHTSNVQGTAQTGYSGTQTINTDSVSPNLFRLRQTASGNGVNTFNMQNGINHALAVDFTDANNVWNNVNPSLNQYATDAHWGAEQTYDYFFTKFNRNSINNNGFALNSYVHYNTNYANAFWDGQRMTYGDGNGIVTPLVALDIAGHEIVHGLTTFSANLLYQKESGALNESFSDIFGTAIEFYARPGRANWTLGEDIGSTFRSLSNPNVRGDPDTYDGTYWRNTTNCVPSNQNDLCGVHINSGVQNFWFYLLVNGGSGTNDNSDFYNVNAIGMDTAASVAYRNLTVYLGRLSNFQDARYYSIQSAIDLYGACSPAVQSVTNAWYAVGVGSPYQAGVISDFTSADTIECTPPLTVSFQNQSNNGERFYWDFGNGQLDTTQSPTHTYLSYGLFDVKLVTDGGNCGIDSITKTAFIDIDTANICQTVMVNGTNPTQLDCSGRLFDTGGSSGNYQNNENATITIAPPGASSISLNINSLDIEAGTNGNCNYDYLEIFDGASVNSPSLGVFCNGKANLPSNLTTNFGAVTIQFISDPGVTESGFDISWSCNFPSTRPQSDFTFSTDSSCTGLVQFDDFSTEAPSSWFWDFGDGNSSVQQNPSHTYLSNGNFTVELIATNSFGSDTIRKINIIHVDRPTQPSTFDDSICSGENVLLTANGMGTLRWYDQEVGGSRIQIGDSIQLNSVDWDSTVWVEDYIASPTQAVGPQTNTIGSGANFNNFQHLIFDAHQDIELVSVRVYAGNSATRLIQLRDSNGIEIQTLSRYIAVGQQTVPLNLKIEKGSNYQLGVSPSSTTIDLYRNNGGVSYPYTIPGKVSIKRSSAGSNPFGFYYFFYNWQVKGADCISPRTAARVLVDTNCSITNIKSVETQKLRIHVFPNPAKDRLSVDLSSFNDELEIIELLSLSGQVVLRRTSEFNSNLVNLNIADLSSGIYFIRIQTGLDVITKKIIINN